VSILRHCACRKGKYGNRACQAVGKGQNRMTEKANKARMIGMLIAIVFLILALLWKRVLR